MMRPNAWARLASCAPELVPSDWLEVALEHNADCAYLRRFGSPRSVDSFRNDVPAVTYDELRSWIAQIECGHADVLFKGRPVAFERTAGNSGGGKLVPYSIDGLTDFRRSLLPWIRGMVRRHDLSGRGYFSISPATRAAQDIAGVPVGLPDAAYLGDEAGAALSDIAAVPVEVAAIADVECWRRETLRYLAAASDLELISVWSPTFLLRLLDDLPDPVALWPRLKVVSCWASGPSAEFAAVLASRLPHARLEPKGLLSTETVVTVPDSHGRPVLTQHGFFEFEREGRLCLQEELEIGATYEVIATTASGLYRYRTGDLVHFEGAASDGSPVLEFVGRGDVVCDLVGEKLSEPFVSTCLSTIRGFRFLTPEPAGDGYVLAVEAGQRVDSNQIETRLCSNPQYAYARRLGQLRPLRVCSVDRLFDRYSGLQAARGVRLGDVKPVSLRKERTWVTMLGLQA
jgi:hypothetical protein